MNRNLIIVLTLITAIVHLVVLNLGEHILPMFVANGLGYLALLGAFVWGFPKGQERLVLYAFIAYTAVTIAAWAAIGTRDTLAYGTKLVEVLLIYFLWQNLKSLPAKKS